MKLIIFLTLCISYVLATHYHTHDHVGIVANTVGPFNNPTETYPVIMTRSLKCAQFYKKYLIDVVLLTSFLFGNWKTEKA